MAGNAVAAVVELLSGLAAGRVYGVKLPADQIEHMPREAIVVRAAGGAGFFGGGYLPTVDDRADVRCYGATSWEAHQLSTAAGLILHQVREETTSQGRVMWARRGGGPNDVTETQTGWELVLTSWQVMGEWLDA